MLSFSLESHVIQMFMCENCPFSAFPIFPVCDSVCVDEEFYSPLYTDEGHLQGEEAKNIPGESMTEEHYLDHDGNLISRKVTYTSGTSIFHRNRPPTKSRMFVDQSHDLLFPF